jgi:hypothetical protein
MRTQDPSTAARMQVPSGRLPGLMVHTRDGTAHAESEFEKPMILPAIGEMSPSLHAWADARFITDILAEHALFFMLLMPEELAAPERAEADRFRRQYLESFERIEVEGPPAPGELKAFAHRVLESIKPFVDYKARLQDAQTSGRLRSLAWPLFFEHTRHEAERWIRRLEAVAAGESEFDKQEVSHFWTNIMDEHARFVAHLLDPDEFELIDKCMKTSKVFCHLHDGGVGGVVGALVDEPGGRDPLTGGQSGNQRRAQRRGNDPGLQDPGGARHRGRPHQEHHRPAPGRPRAARGAQVRRRAAPGALTCPRKKKAPPRGGARVSPSRTTPAAACARPRRGPTAPPSPPRSACTPPAIRR